MGITGYDNTTKKYTSTWTDNMSTALHVMEGTASDAQTINQEGEFTCPLKGRMKLRSVMKIVDNNTNVFEMHGTDDKSGQEQKMMEITYTRKSQPLKHASDAHETQHEALAREGLSASCAALAIPSKHIG